MLDIVIDELKAVFVAVETTDAQSYAFHIGKAGGVAAATGAWITLVDDDAGSDSDDIVYECRVLCDAISTAYEYNFLDEIEDILTELIEQADGGGECDESLADSIGWPEYGAALNEAVKAKEADDHLRYALMMGFVSGLMLNNPGPSHPEHGTILDAITTAYETDSDAALQYARARISTGVRMTDPAPFMGNEQHDRYMEEKLRTLRWVQNFGLHHARAGDETVAVPGSMAINDSARRHAQG